MKKPNYSVDIEKKDDYLLLRARGTRTRDNVVEIAKEVFQKALAAKKQKIILDVRELKGELSVVDDYYIVRDLFEQLRGKGIQKAAIIDMKESPIHEWFIEIVARNRGFNFRVFDNEESALQWLENR
jgi:spore coat polysaccharide biosynthesis predicted glycosyltransferase SpsG